MRFVRGVLLRYPGRRSGCCSATRPKGGGRSPRDGVEGFGIADSGIYHFCGVAAFTAPDPLGLGHPRQRIVPYGGVCLIPGVAALTTPDPLGLGHLRQRIVRYEGVCLIPGGAAPPLNKTSA